MAPVSPKNSAGAAALKRESTLVKAQAVAGALFFIFLILHLSNTLLAVFGPEIYNGYQRAIRQIYQHPVLEVVLVIAPLITHAIAGAWLYLIRKKWQINRKFGYRVQTWAGFFLLSVVFVHVLATRGISFWYGPFADFAGVSFSLWWVPGYFYPYYFLLFLAGIYHGMLGATSLLRRSKLIGPTKGKWLTTIATAFAAVSVTLALLAFGGVLFEIDDPRDNDYARQYSELLGVDLSRPRN